MKIILLLVSLISMKAISETCDNVRTKYDGGIILFEEKNDSIRIYPGKFKPLLSPNDIDWEWKVSDAKSASFRSAFRKTKNDVKRVMFRNELHLLIVSSRGDAVALLNFRTKKVSWWKKIPGSVHSADLTPYGVAVADAKGYIKLFSTNSNRLKGSCRLNGAHGVVWDRQRQKLWGWGSKMVGYDIDNTLDCHGDIYSGLPAGAHDLQLYGDGLTLIGSGGKNIFWFNPDRSRKWGYLRKTSMGMGIKGVSRNYDTGEIIFVTNDRSNGFKFRSDTIRSLRGMSRVLTDRTATYKIRWFQPSCL